MAGFLLVAGALGTLGLVDRANEVTSMSKQRTGAANLAREVIEDARSLDYDTLTPTGLAPALQALPGLAGSGNPWSVARQHTTYSVSVSVCTFDDPKDGLASGSSLSDACPSTATGTHNDDNPDDFRRVTVTVSWSGGPSPGASHSVTFTSLIINPSGGLAPRLSLSSISGQLVSTSLTEVDLTATTTAPATSVHWEVDDGVSKGDATGGPTAWTVPWTIGSVADPCTRPTGSATYVYDGSYQVTAQDFDERGAAGDSRVATVLLNRCAPVVPTGVGGGHDTRLGGVVDFEWNANPERDIVGYRVYDLGGNGTLDPDDRVACSTSSATDTSCTDTSDAAKSATGDLSYAVVALDHTDLADPSSALRTGTAKTLTVSPASGSPPSWPDGTTLTADIADGIPQLTWSAAATGGSGGVAFYRIYRDTGTTLADRYDATAGATTSWDDNAPGTSTAHQYWVTAVDAHFNESAPLGPVTSP